MSLNRWTATASLAGVLWTGAAFACPACAGRDNANPNRVQVYLGAMILLPWTVSAAVIVSLRKLQQRDAEETSNHGDLDKP